MALPNWEKRYNELQKILNESNKILYHSLGSYMKGAHIANLSEKITEQETGIILVWKPYVDNVAGDYDINYTFIPKWQIETGLGGRGIDCILVANNFTNVGCKYLYINDENIQGHDRNTASGTGASGIKYNNSYWVLTDIIGF